MYAPNYDKYNYHFCRSKLLVENYEPCWFVSTNKNMLEFYKVFNLSNKRICLTGGIVSGVKSGGMPFPKIGATI